MLKPIALAAVLLTPFAAHADDTMDKYIEMVVMGQALANACTVDLLMEMEGDPAEHYKKSCAAFYEHHKQITTVTGLFPEDAFDNLSVNYNNILNQYDATLLKLREVTLEWKDSQR